MQISSEFFSGRNILSKNTSIILFFMDGCGHCEEMKPEWSRFAMKSPIPALSFDIATAPGRLRGDLSSLVPGVPTIVLYINGQPYVKYTGPRTYDGFMRFANSKANVPGNFEKVGR